MIIVRLKGSMGNQLFQYATGRHLAHLNNAPLFLDTTYFNSSNITTQWKYELDAFNIAGSIATADLLRPFNGCKFSNSDRLKVYLTSFGKYKKFLFEQYGFNDEVLELRGNYYLKGYYQSEKYFKSVANILRQELTIKEAFFPKNNTIVNQIKNTKSVSIHIRHGDYIRNISAMDARGLCSKDYYTKSIEYMKRELGDDIHFYLFTDDENWVKREMQWDIDTTLITGNTMMEDFYLMSLCQNNIISNSTYSWWAAWLNDFPEKKVVMPKHWGANVKTEDIDLNPPKWLTK
jgi:hypothetical protein